MIKHNLTQEVSCKIANMSLLCAIFVVMIHCASPMKDGSLSWYLSKLIFNGVTCVAVPFFFLASGYFLGTHKIEDGEYLSELRKRLRSLVLPLYFWNAAFWIFNIVLIVGTNFFYGEELSRNLEPIISRVFDLTGLGLKLNLGPLWYVRTLLILVIVSPLLVRLNKSRAWLIVPLLLSTVTYILFRPELNSVHDPVLRFIRYVLSPTGWLYFSIGLYLSRNKIEFHLSRWHYAVFFTIGMLLLFVKTQIQQIPGHLLALREFSIPFRLLGVWGAVPSFQLPKVLSGISFPVYVLHLFFLRLLRLCPRFSPFHVLQNVDDWMVYVTRVVVGVLVSVGAAMVFKRLFPRISKCLLGGR